VEIVKIHCGNNWNNCVVVDKSFLTKVMMLSSPQNRREFEQVLTVSERKLVGKILYGSLENRQKILWLKAPV